MKRILLTALTLTSMTSFAQLKPGLPGGNYGGQSSVAIQQIQYDLQATRLSLQTALNYLKVNPKISAGNIQQALMRLDSVSVQVSSLGINVIPEVTGYYVTLKSSSGRLYPGEASTRLQAIERAQKACFSANTFTSNCQTSPDLLTVETLSNYNTTEQIYCSLKSSSGKNYGSAGRVAAEATLKAQMACVSANTFASNCQVSVQTVTCE